MNADMLSNRKLNPIVTESFIRVRKLSISRIFTTQSYFTVLKNIRLNSTHYFIMKVSNKKNPQQNVHNYSSDIYFKDFMNVYKNMKFFFKTIHFFSYLCYSCIR